MDFLADARAAFKAGKVASHALTNELQAHNMRVARAFGKLEQRAASWKKLDAKIRDLADMTAS